MKNQKISSTQWHELDEQEKEILRQWAVKHDLGLDIIEGHIKSFDPSCDYAALLDSTQMQKFLEEYDSGYIGKPPEQNLQKIWWEVKELLETLKHQMQEKS